MCAGMPIHRVVILDDDAEIEQLYKLFLTKICPGTDECLGGICDHCYKFYSDIDLFLKGVKRNDIIVLDYILNDIKNGLDVAKIIRDKFGSEVFIILYSSFIDNNTIAESTRLEFVDEVVLKPSPDKLIKLITEREKKYGLPL